MDAEQHEWVADHMGLAQSIAMQVWRTAPHALDLDDLRATAYHGLVMAVDRWRPYCAKRGFDPARFEYFKQFVGRRVYGAIYDEIRRSDWATRSLRTRARQLQDAGQDKGASHTELAARTGLTVAEIRATQRGMAQRRPMSLEGEDLDPHTDTDVESAAFTSALLTVVVDVIASLDPDQQTVIALHYWRGLQLQEIAKVMGITETRASHLHARAVLTIHDAMLAAARHTEE